MSSPKSPAARRLAIGQRSSGFLLSQEVVSIPNQKTEEPSAAELQAAARLRRLFRGIVLRRRWLRLVRVIVAKADIVRRIEDDQEKAVREAAALVLFRVWKRRARTVQSVVRIAMRAHSEAEERAALMETTCDFGQTALLSSANSVDWQDMTAANKLLSTVMQQDSKELQTRLADILDGDTTVLEGEDLEKTRNDMEALMPIFEAKAAPVQEVEVDAVIDAATLSSLIYFATTSSYAQASNVWNIMISTTREWMSDDKLFGLKLIRLLHLRFLQGQEDVRNEVGNCLRGWLAHDKSFAVKQLRSYLEKVTGLLPAWLKDDFCSVLGPLRALLRSQESINHQRRHRLNRRELVVLEMARSVPTELPLAEAPKPWKVPVIPPIELARQMTLIEYEVFALIKPSEFFNSAWNGKKKEKLAPNVLLLTSRFNQLASWVSKLILGEKSPADRGYLIQYFICVQRELFAMHNFHGVMELHAVLSSSHISRLRKSWKLVPAVELLSFAHIDSRMSPSSNYREYRKLLRSADSTPCIPYLGAWLTDLTFLAESPTWIKRDEEGLPRMLNLSKLSKFSGVLASIRNFQQLPYPYQHERQISYYLMAEITNVVVVRDQDLYNLSLELEPRDPNWQQKRMLRKELSKGSRFDSMGVIPTLGSRNSLPTAAKPVEVKSPRK